MSIFYIKRESEDVLFELHATETIQINHVAEATQKRLESGLEAADNVVAKNITGSFDGVLTHLKLLSVKDQSTGQQLLPVGGNFASLFGEGTNGNATLEKYFMTIRYLQESGERVSIYYDERFPPLNNCIITGASYNRDASTGKGLKVAIRFEQLRVIEQASTTEIDSPQADPDLTGSGGGTSGSSTEDGDELSRSIIDNIVQGVGNSINLGG